MGASVPPEVEEVFENALVALLTTLNERSEPVTHPMLPLYERGSGRIYFTSSVLFSKKLEHIKRNPKVSVHFSVSEYMRAGGVKAVTVKGRARVDDRNLSEGWMRLLPLWRKKEPYIDAFLKQRFAFPLFWERAVIEVTPEEAIVWREDPMSTEPEKYSLRGERG
ncbi:MAG: pyridoxamine 5'-phosphate oxidase family protein [Thaumarchaeota archaeon]|nr:pyridoxamine 5'-phosphate oxidase family protein [Candidatus Calditenuaceae archaeon]MDW8041410.1 pyridoxamine 5'-phosphate oxidase family protein [Nitrososphaerota archaeon]